jgi:hypothetical protein
MERFNIIHMGVLEELNKRSEFLTQENLVSGTSYPGATVLSTSMPYNMIL